MKRLVILVALTLLAVHLAWATDVEPKAICIEHIGESDKPVAGISISSSHAGIRECHDESERIVGLANLWRHVIDTNLMGRLLAITDDVTSDHAPTEFGSLAFVIINGNKKRVIVLNPAHSISLLDTLMESCTDSPLRVRLNELRKRIAPR